MFTETFSNALYHSVEFFPVLRYYQCSIVFEHPGVEIAYL